MALSFVQGVVKSIGTTPAVFPAFGSSVAVGDLIVVNAGGDGGAVGLATGVTDSLGNTYTQVPSFDFANVGGTLNMDAWYSVATVAGAANVISVAFNDGLENFNGVAQHFNGFTGVATLDQKATSSNASSTTCTSGATSATSQAVELVIGFGIHASTASAFSLGVGYTNLTQSNVSARAAAMESKVTASTGAQTATFTIAAARVNMGGVLTFYDLASGSNLTKNLSDSVTSTDAVSNRPALVKSDTASTADAIAKTVGLGKTDSATSGDGFSSIVSYIRSLSDTSSVADAISKAIGKVFGDTATATDAITLTKLLLLMLSDSVSTSDAITKAVGKKLSDTSTATDAQTRSQGWRRTLTDTATAADAISKQARKNLTDVAFASDARELITNPSFETGTSWPVTGWETSQNAPGISIDNSQSYTGTQSLKLTIDGSSTNTGIRQSSAATMTVQPNTAYRFRMYAKSSTAGELQIQFSDRYTIPGALFLQANGSWTTTATSYRNWATTTDWQVFTVDFTTAVGQTTLTIKDIKRSSNTSQANRNFWIDAASIEEISLVKSVGKKATDSVTVTDAFTRQMQLARTLADSVTVTDATQKQVGKVVVDTVTVTDAIRKAYGLSLADAVTVTDAMAKAMAYLLSLSDEVFATDDFSYTLVQVVVAIAAAIDVILDDATKNVSLETEGTVVIVDNRHFDVPLDKGTIDVDLEG